MAGGSIRVKGLGKAYRQYRQRWGRLAEWLWPWGGARHSLKWVLQDVSFELQPGEAVGIIGVNGAGKSTLLKLITGTTQPTTGAVTVQGRVAALLELGMGFHPDFTGRQNAVMAGQLVGLSAQTMHTLMPAVESFAEIGAYMDAPVRVYSSGMQMRLAFAVATCQRPDVLIVDEALSVGDAYFQHKSFERIRSFARQGTTLLLVSHDKAAIQAICERAILLDAGQVRLQDKPEAVMDAYNALIAEAGQRSLRQVRTAGGAVQTVSGTGEAGVESIALCDAQGAETEVVGVGDAVCLRVVVRAKAALDALVLGYGIKDRLGQVVYGTNTWYSNQVASAVQQGERLVFEVHFVAALGVGSYSIQTALVDRESHLSANYEWRDLALVFEVINRGQQPFVGCAWLQPRITLERA